MSNRLRFLLRRTAWAVFTLWGAVTLMFILFRAVPGDPALALLGPRATPAAVAQLNHEYGLDQPAWQQYIGYVGRLLRADLGDSFQYNRPVSDVIAAALPTTIELATYAVVLTALITVTLAVIAAVRVNRPIDYAIRSVPVLGLGLPTFWIGTMLLLVFGLELRLFPAGGLQSGFAGHLASLFLPACSLAISFVAVLVRSLRASLLEVLESDHVLAARARGVSGTRLIFSHVLPSALIPTVTLLGLIFGSLLGGALITESVFALPGIGSLLVGGFQAHDFALVQGITLVAAVAIVVINIAIDILYSIIDPRVGLS
jgi:peptide/nickel transport system permease protein